MNSSHTPRPTHRAMKTCHKQAIKKIDFSYQKHKQIK